MEPIPYRITEEDVDEVLSAYGASAWTHEVRRRARDHVLRNLVDIDEIVRTALEDDFTLRSTEARVRSAVAGPSAARRETALAAIEDLLIRDGFLTITDNDARTFPMVTYRDDERADL